MSTSEPSEASTPVVKSYAAPERAWILDAPLHVDFWLVLTVVDESDAYNVDAPVSCAELAVRVLADVQLTVDDEDMYRALAMVIVDDATDHVAAAMLVTLLTLRVLDVLVKVPDVCESDVAEQVLDVNVAMADDRDQVETLIVLLVRIICAALA